ncbi:MAG: anti-sigma factor [Chitinophagaceae bacterium]|nr:anti-sigma factor [Chitinophagaceae bacterium]
MDIQSYISSGIIELYVMGLCTPEEEKELEQLRSQYPQLRQAIEAYELQVEKNMLKQATLPPAATDERILKELESLQGAAVVPMNIKADKKEKTTIAGKWWKIAAAASLVLFLGSAYFNYTLLRQKKSLEVLVKKEGQSPLPLADYAVITNPSITPVGMYGQGTHTICRCTMFWDKKTGKAYVMIHHLPQSNEVKDYQLWAEVEGKPVSVGIIDDSIRGRLIEVSNVPAGAVAFKVVLGKAGGETSPENGDLYLAGRI